MFFAKDHISLTPDKIVVLVRAELLFPRSTGPPQNT